MAVGLAVEAGLAIGSAGFRAVMNAIDARHERREDKAQLIELLESAIVTAHRREFPLRSEPRWENPEPINRRSTRSEYRRRAVSPYPWWRLLARHTAAREAAQAADKWCVDEDARRWAAAEAAYDRACELWPGLQVNDPRAVLAALDDAFEDNAMPAFAVHSEGPCASAVMVTGTSDALPKEIVDRDARGRPAFRRRDNAAQLHRDSVFSNALASAKEALAVCPKLSQVQVVAVERREPVLRKRAKLVPLCLLRVTRDELAAIEWSSAGIGIFEALAHTRYELDEHGRGLRPIDLGEEPDVQAVVAAVAEALDCRT
jgi:hypothetical protein